MITIGQLVKFHNKSSVLGLPAYGYPLANNANNIDGEWFQPSDIGLVIRKMTSQEHHDLFHYPPLTMNRLAGFEKDELENCTVIDCHNLPPLEVDTHYYVVLVNEKLYFIDENFLAPIS